MSRNGSVSWIVGHVMRLPLFFVVVLVACRTNDDPEGAEELIAQVQADDYQSWRRAPGYEQRRASTAPHSDNVEIFVNDVVSDALDGNSREEWPDGSIIVKDGYADDDTHDLTAIMEKRDGVWFWAEYDANDEPLYSGAPSICTDCHDSGADFVRAFELPD